MRLPHRNLKPPALIDGIPATNKKRGAGRDLVWRGGMRVQTRSSMRERAAIGESSREAGVQSPHPPAAPCSRFASPWPHEPHTPPLLLRAGPIIPRPAWPCLPFCLPACPACFICVMGGGSGGRAGAETCSRLVGYAYPFVAGNACNGWRSTQPPCPRPSPNASSWPTDRD